MGTGLGQVRVHWGGMGVCREVKAAGPEGLGPFWHSRAQRSARQGPHALCPPLGSTGGPWLGKEDAGQTGAKNRARLGTGAGTGGRMGLPLRRLFFLPPCRCHVAQPRPAPGRGCGAARVGLRGAAAPGPGGPRCAAPLPAFSAPPAQRGAQRGRTPCGAGAARGKNIPARCRGWGRLGAELRALSPRPLTARSAVLLGMSRSVGTGLPAGKVGREGQTINPGNALNSEGNRAGSPQR